MPVAKESDEDLTFINLDNLKNKRYVVWVLSTAFMFLGYYTPYIRVVEFVNDQMPGNNGSIIPSLIPVTSCIFR